ncbi:MAG: DUF7544 domain-containing protein [Nanobdellota archaeon]
MAIATEIIDDSLNKIKKRLFPLNKEWFKLGLVSLLSASGSNGGNVSNITNFGDFSKITHFLKNNFAFILAGGGVLALIGLLWKVVSFTFTFIFIDSVVTGKTIIKKGFSKHINKALSVFLLSFAIGFANLLVVGIVSLPVLIPLIKNIDNLSLQNFSIAYLIFFVIFFIIDIIIFLLINWFIKNIIIYDMYRKNKSLLDSIKRSLYLLRNNPLEVFVFFLMKIVLGIVGGLIVVFAFLVLLIPFGLVGLAIGLLFVFGLFGGGVANLLLIIPAIITGLVYLLLFSYTLNVVILPVNAFFISYTYNFVNVLSKKNKI